jgi:Vacuolar sorting protein 9 (VPS9) domain
MMNSEMRSAVIRHHNAKTEIESMDEELPITIFVLSRVKCKQMYSHLHYVRHYLKAKEESDNQERVVSNILVSVDYIAKEWKLDEIKKPKSPEQSASKINRDSPKKEESPEKNGHTDE